MFVAMQHLLQHSSGQAWPELAGSGEKLVQLMLEHIGRHNMLLGTTCCLAQPPPRCSLCSPQARKRIFFRDSYMLCRPEES